MITVRQAFLERLINGGKFDCQCCGRYAQIYKRSLSETVAWQLIKLHRESFSGEWADGWVHASHLIPEGQTGVGDLGKAKYFNLIEEKPTTSSKMKKSGCWRLTPKGVAYVLGVEVIPSYVMVFDDQIIETSDKMESIFATVGRKFDYEQLMRGF